MITGIGTDLVEITRIEAVMNRHGDRFIRRILHPAEYGVALTARSVAKLFAAKEAVSKALGTGMRWPVTWQQIIIVHDQLGRPLVSADKALSAWLSERHLQLHLSLSDEKAYAVATAVSVDTSFYRVT